MNVKIFTVLFSWHCVAAIAAIPDSKSLPLKSESTNIKQNMTVTGKSGENKIVVYDDFENPSSTGIISENTISAKSGMGKAKAEVGKRRRKYRNKRPAKRKNNNRNRYSSRKAKYRVWSTLKI